MFPTVADVLELPALRQGRPKVVAGLSHLGRRVRWTHVAELPDIAHLLRGGELLLSTGVALPEGDQDLRHFVAEVSNVEVAGLVIELGRRFVHELPSALVEAAEAHGLVLIELRRETPFVQVTESVHALIVDAQLAELRISEQIHQTFTELSVEGAAPTEVIRQTARMARAPVVLENVSHQVLAFDPAGGSAEDLLDRWESRSRSIGQAERTYHDPGSGWLVTTVGARGTDWGRLVICLSDQPTARDVMLIERSAATLALNRMVERDRESLERQTHRTLLTGMVSHDLTAAEMQLRAKALGVPVENRALVAVVLRHQEISSAPLEAQAGMRELAEVAASSLRGLRALGLVGGLTDDTVGVLLSVSDRARVDGVLDRFSARVRQQYAEQHAAGKSGPAGGLVIAAGSTVTDVLQARRSFEEAAQVADAAVHQPPRPIFRLPDVRLRGLVQLLRDDSRLQTYVERELGPLLAYDGDRGSDLIGVLRTYLAAGRNKSAAADASHLSRPSFYERLHRIEVILGVELDDVETCLSLHVALVALDAVRS
ncbi:MAG TPA: PucR family transcriptional regulator ligand-binding domain-containing protein [Actinomycetes bacterium]|nr:PucR family transcriptional regulator ligand-binding domain-containing protein [Actinomycetes bacterium]